MIASRQFEAPMEQSKPVGLLSIARALSYDFRFLPQRAPATPLARTPSRPWRGLMPLCLGHFITIVECHGAPEVTPLIRSHITWPGSHSSCKVCQVSLLQVDEG